MATHSSTLNWRIHGQRGLKVYSPESHKESDMSELTQPARKPNFSSVQSLSCVQLFVTPWIAAHQAFLSITSSRSLLKLMSNEWVMPSNYLILCHPLLPLPSILPSIMVFSNESVLCIRWPKYWSLSFSISPSNEYSGLISFRMDWLDLLIVQRTFKSLLQHHSSKASILQCSAFFMVQLSHPLHDHWKNQSFDQTDLCQQRTGSAFLVCCLGWSWLFFQGASSFNIMAAVTICSDFGAQENKVCHCFHCFSIYLP